MILTPTPVPNGPHPLIWYASNTPHQISQTQCDFLRWLTQHAGPHGTGWRLKATASPLATGTAVHKGLELIGEWILDYQAAYPTTPLLQIPPEVIAWAAEEAAAAYEARARAKGLQITNTDVDTAPAINQLIMEQRTLIEALVWIWGLVRLPALLVDYTLFALESEDVIVHDCTCGLGDGIAELPPHIARGCAGIGYMSKADQLWMRRGGNTLTYLQFKTWGSVNAGKRKALEHSGQLLFDAEAATRRYGIPVDEIFVDVLIKGWRGRDKGAPDTEPKYQHTFLAYGYHDPAVSLSFSGNDQGAHGWAPEFRFFDHVALKNRQLPSSYKKVPIWQPERPLPVVREGASRVENWVRGVLNDQQRAECLEVMGPFPRVQLRVPLAIQGIKAEERRWRADVEYLREQGAVMPNHPLVDELIGRSWNCTNYDGTPCVAQRVCFREIGWEDPESTGRFERRRPHHVPEAEAVIALGHVLPAGDDEIGGDDGGE
jgi:hypothetical protein